MYYLQFTYSPKETKENYKNIQSGWPFSNPRFEPGISHIQERRLLPTISSR